MVIGFRVVGVLVVGLEGGVTEGLDDDGVTVVLVVGGEDGIAVGLEVVSSEVME